MQFSRTGQPGFLQESSYSSMHTKILWRNIHKIPLQTTSCHVCLRCLFLSWYDFRILVKSRRGGAFLCLLTFDRINFFQLKAKYPVFHSLDLEGTILNLIQPKINRKHQNFHCFLKFSIFYSLYSSDLSSENIV